MVSSIARGRLAFTLRFRNQSAMVLLAWQGKLILSRTETLKARKLGEPRDFN